MTLSTKPTDRARRLAKFWKQIEENDKVRSVYGGSVVEAKMSVYILFNRIPWRPLGKRRE